VNIVGGTRNIYPFNKYTKLEFIKKMLQTLQTRKYRKLFWKWNLLYVEWTFNKLN